MTAPEFRPSHVVPPGGMPTWADPGAGRPLVPLDPLLPVQVVERHGDWARALCSNGWSAWVDGRLLLSVPHDPPTAEQPAAWAADPRPLLAAAEGALSRYRQLVEEMLAGRVDREAFGERSRGTRVGAVVDGDAVWLYDARHGRWCFCDGESLVTFAVSDGPMAEGPEAREAAEAAEGGPPCSNSVERSGEVADAAGTEGTGGTGSTGSAGSTGTGGGLPGEAEFPPPYPPIPPPYPPPIPPPGGTGERP
ncbi:hypothetical protein [Streptomyces yunnanensis]|uniref:Uncharacterized protein n=1 Tax=Streptomyces yunnanensis TaxID=156453 RepID=A0A9X8N8P2_9ACTN|nr:hypothetical protein [Streptomyces yunnanensis]SHN29204.1 hypothetical protein SAMN05216268_13063 [Streptomyces yunnanensis]